MGVTQQVSKAAAMGLEQFLFLVLVITVNLGVFNLLPIPALDGGRLFFQLIELVFRKPIPQKWEGRIHLIGLALLLLLMVVITGQDIIRIFAKCRDLQITRIFYHNNNGNVNSFLQKTAGF